MWCNNDTRGVATRGATGGVAVVKRNGYGVEKWMWSSFVTRGVAV